MRIVSLTLLTASAIACGDRGEAQWEDQLQSLAREVIPGVERAVGLPFKYPPAVAVRSREAVREYLISQLAKDLPPEEIERLTLAYRLFGLIPDTLDLESLLLGSSCVSLSPTSWCTPCRPNICRLTRSSAPRGTMTDVQPRKLCSRGRGS